MTQAALDRELEKGRRSEGRRVLARQRTAWRTFVNAMQLITGVDHA
jgi:hypothetical protein